MELFEAIQKRYCYRDAFKEIKPSRDDLKKIVEAGLAAPSGRNAQTVEFVIIDDFELLKKIGSMHTMPAMHTAGAMIACIVDKQAPAVYEGHAFPIEDCATAAENILLAITALGYASVWIDGWLRLNDRAKIIGKLLGLPQAKIVRVLLPIGVSVISGKRQEKKPFEQRAWFNRYGKKS